MEFRLDETIQDYANIKVWEDDTINVVLSHFHLGQETNYVIQLKSFKEGFHLEFDGGMFCKFHLPASIGIIATIKGVLNRLHDVLESFQVIVNHLKFIGDHSTVLHHWQKQKAK